MSKKIITGIALLCLAVIPVLVYHACFVKKVAYVDIPKVFNAFAMKKEMQEKYKRTEAARAKVLDSLSFELQHLSAQLRAKQDDKSLAAAFFSEYGAWTTLRTRVPAIAKGLGA